MKHVTVGAVAVGALCLSLAPNVNAQTWEFFDPFQARMHGAACRGVNGAAEASLYRTGLGIQNSGSSTVDVICGIERRGRKPLNRSDSESAWEALDMSKLEIGVSRPTAGLPSLLCQPFVRYRDTNSDTITRNGINIGTALSGNITMTSTNPLVTSSPISAKVLNFGLRCTLPAGSWIHFIDTEFRTGHPLP